MSITPIEVAAMAPKSYEASHFKQQESQRPINEQLQIHNQIDKKIQQNNQQTVKTDKSEYKEYRYDEKEKGSNSNSGSNQKRKKSQSDKGTSAHENIRLGSIDIKV